MEKKDEEGLLIYDGAVLEKHQRRTSRPINFPVARDEMAAAFFSYAMGLVVLIAIIAMSRFTSFPVPTLVSEFAPIILLAWLTPIPGLVVYEIYTAIIVGRPL